MPGRAAIRDARGRRTRRCHRLPHSRPRDRVPAHRDRGTVPRPRRGQPPDPVQSRRRPGAPPVGAALLPVRKALDRRAPRLPGPGPRRPPPGLRPIAPACPRSVSNHTRRRTDEFVRAPPFHGREPETERLTMERTAQTASTHHDESAFAALTERHRRELHVHCYRMLASFDEAQDAVQETFLKAWRGRSGFDGGTQFRAWLYRIATNVCLDMLRRSSRRITGSGSAEVSWLQPYPDLLLDQAAPDDEQPEAVVIERETISLAF